METQSSKYPYDIEHYNPKSDKYIPDHRLEKDLHQSTDDYNQILSNIKRDLETQKSVMDYIKNMKRPYMDGLRGNERSVYD